MMFLRFRGDRQQNGEYAPKRNRSHQLKRAKRKPTNKMTSYEYLLQGKFHKRKLTKDDANIAVDMFTNAIESDPSNGRAYAERCCTWADGLDHSWFEESDDDLRKKIRTTLEDAYELTDHDWDCHRFAVQHFFTS